MASGFEENVALSLQLPRIVVVGAESAGKSSVIERLANLRLFPRGEHITTRMPVELLLRRRSVEELQELIKIHNIPETNPNPRIVVCIENGNNQAEYLVANPQLPENIRERIATVQNSINGIRTQVFRIRIYSPDVTDMELVDIPGVVRGILPGEPSDLDQQTENLTRQYVQNPNTLVLAVLPCTEHIPANLIWFIQSYPNIRQRCIGVLTKCDLVMNQTTAANKISGLGAVDLHFGYIGLCNLMERDGNPMADDIDLSSILGAEHHYFSQPAFERVRQDGRVGLNALTEFVIKAFKEHIRASLNGTSQLLNEVARNANARKVDLGVPLTEANFQDFTTHVAHLLQSPPPSCDEYQRGVTIECYLETQIEHLIVSRFSNATFPWSYQRLAQLSGVVLEEEFLVKYFNHCLDSFITRVFEEIEPDNLWRLGRFSHSIRRFLTSRYSAPIQSIQAAFSRRIDKAKDSGINERIGDNFYQKSHSSFVVQMRYIFYETVIDDFVQGNGMAFLLSMGHSFFVENQETINQRQDIDSFLQEIEVAQVLIRDIVRS